jgi:hypothetical protein
MAARTLNNLQGVDHTAARTAADAARDDGGFRKSRLREIPAALSLLGLPETEPNFRGAGLQMLAHIADACRLGTVESAEPGSSYRAVLTEFQRAVVAARGVPVVVRALTRRRIALPLQE